MDDGQMSLLGGSLLYGSRRVKARKYQNGIKIKSKAVVYFYLDILMLYMVI